MKQRFKTRLVLIVAAVLACLTIISSFGDPIPLLPFSPVELWSPSVAATDGSTTAVVIDQARRLAVIDAEGRLTALVNFEAFETPIEVATHVCVSQERIYVAGLRRAPEGDVIQTERIVSYDLDGQDQQTVYECKGKGVLPQIRMLEDTQEGVLFALLDSNEGEQGAHLSIRTTTDGGKQELRSLQLSSSSIVAVSCSQDASKIETLSQRGVIDDQDLALSADQSSKSYGRIFTSISIGADSNIYACDSKTGELCRIDKDDNCTVVNADSFHDHVRHYDNYLCTVSRDTDEVSVLNLDGVELARYGRVMPSTGIAVEIVLVWISIAYLVVLGLGLGIRAIVRLLQQGRVSELVAPFTSLAIMLTVGLALGNGALVSYRTQRSIRANEVSSYASYLDYLAPRLKEPLAPCSDRSMVFKNESALTKQQGEALSQALDQVIDLATAASSNGIGTYVTIYGQDKDGIFCVMDSMCDYVWGETVTGTSNIDTLADTFADKKSSDQAERGSSRFESTLYQTVYVPSPDENGPGLVIEVGSRMKSFTSSAMSSLFSNALALLVLLLVVYLAYVELRACGRCVLSYQRMRAQDEPGAISALARPFALTTMMLAGVDGVMSTLIAKDLLAAGGYENASALVAVPAIMLGVGQALGEGVYGMLGAKTPLRKLMTWGSALMVACAVFAGGAVAAGNFWAYCAAKFALAIPFGLLYTAAYSLRRHAQSKEQQELAKDGVKRSNTSSAALGTALGGYAAQALGNAWVYAVIALVSLALIAMTLHLVPADTRPPEDQRDFSSDERARMRKFLLSPQALGIGACLILPSVVVTGYASFLFPLFSSEMGFSKADINNMYLLGQLVVFVSISGIDLLAKVIGNWRSGLYALIGLGLVFCAFSLNTTVIWGMVVIALVGVLVKTVDAWKPLWTDAAADADVPIGWATGAMFVVRSLSRIAKPFILGALLVRGQASVLILGAFCLACAVIFYLATRPRALEPAAA